MLEFLGAIPPTAGAIRVEGEEGGATRITLDAYLTGEQFEKLTALRGKELTIFLRSESSN